MKAWGQACQNNGGGTVLIPIGTFLLNTLTFNGPCKGPMFFNINGLLKAPLGKVKDDYWILFEHIDGLTINGQGSLDGQGPSAWSMYNDNGPNPPSVKKKIFLLHIKYFLPF